MVELPWTSNPHHNIEAVRMDVSDIDESEAHES